MKIAGVISSYREGSLLDAAINSLVPACDRIFVLEAPIKGNETGGEHVLPRVVANPKQIQIFTTEEPYENDAAKRTVLLQLAQKYEADYMVSLDGDEVLLWGEYLPDWIARNFEEGTEEEPVAGFPLRLVELDGSVSFVYTRVLNCNLFERYELSSSMLVTTSGEVVGQGNEILCVAGGQPVPLPPLDVPEREALIRWQRHLAKHRPPLQGEPHILHRSLWRSPTRTAERQHEAESRDYAKMKPDA